MPRGKFKDIAKFLYSVYSKSVTGVIRSRIKQSLSFRRYMKVAKEKFKRKIIEVTGSKCWPW